MPERLTDIPVVEEIVVFARRPRAARLDIDVPDDTPILKRAPVTVPPSTSLMNMRDLRARIWSLAISKSRGPAS